MQGFFSFRSLVTSPLIKITYVLGAVLITMAGIGMLLVGAFILVGDLQADRNAVTTLSDVASSLLGGFLLLTVGNVFWRILCESWILFFSIHEILVSMDSALRRMKPKDTTFWDSQP